MDIAGTQVREMRVSMDSTEQQQTKGMQQVQESKVGEKMIDTKTKRPVLEEYVRDADGKSIGGPLPDGEETKTLGLLFLGQPEEIVYIVDPKTAKSVMMDWMQFATTGSPMGVQFIADDETVSILFRNLLMLTVGEDTEEDTDN